MNELWERKQILSRLEKLESNTSELNDNVKKLSDYIPNKLITNVMLSFAMFGTCNQYSATESDIKHHAASREDVRKAVSEEMLINGVGKYDVRKIVQDELSNKVIEEKGNSISKNVVGSPKTDTFYEINGQKAYITIDERPVESFIIKYIETQPSQ